MEYNKIIIKKIIKKKHYRLAGYIVQLYNFILIKIKGQYISINHILKQILWLGFFS